MTLLHFSLHVDVGARLRGEPERRSEAADQPGEGRLQAGHPLPARRPPLRRRPHPQALHLPQVCSTDREEEERLNCTYRVILVV